MSWLKALFGTKLIGSILKLCIFVSILIALTEGFMWLVGQVTTEKFATEFSKSLTEWDELPIPFADQIKNIGKLFLKGYDLHDQTTAKKIKEQGEKFAPQMVLDAIITVTSAFICALLTHAVAIPMHFIYKNSFWFHLAMFFIRVFLSLACVIWLKMAYFTLELLITSVGAYAVQFSALISFGLLWVFLHVKKGFLLQTVLKRFWALLQPFISQVLTWVGLVLLQQLVPNERYAEVTVVVAVWIVAQLLCDRRLFWKLKLPKLDV